MLKLIKILQSINSLLDKIIYKLLVRQCSKTSSRIYKLEAELKDK